MASRERERRRSLPKFGEWDIKNSASADAYSVIVNEARDERKRNRSSGKLLTPRGTDSISRYKKTQSDKFPRKNKWLCWF